MNAALLVLVLVPACGVAPLGRDASASPASVQDAASACPWYDRSRHGEIRRCVEDAVQQEPVPPEGEDLRAG